MKKLKKTLILALAVSLSFGVLGSSESSSLLFADEKKSSQEEDKLSKKEEEKKTYFEALGEKYGEIYATRDFARKKKANNNRHFSSKKEFDKVFNQEHSSDSFSYNQFRSSFKVSYDTHYIKLQNETYKNDELWWFEIAKKYGEAEGQIAGFHDYMNEKKKDPEGIYRELLKDKEIFERFHLKRFDKEVEKDFKDSFGIYFKKGYNRAYQSAIDEEATENSNYEYVTPDEKILTVGKPFYAMRKTAAGRRDSESKMLSVRFPRGTVYDNQPVGVPMALKFKERGSQFEHLPSNLLPQTDIFVLDLQREFDSVEFYQTPELIFKGYMDLPESNAIGVYKWKNGRWKYIPTIRNEKDKLIIAPITERIYKDTDYALFYDKTYKMPNDIRMNWAWEALDVAVRRHHIRYEPKLRPNDVMTRDELADLIYNTISYKVSAPSLPPAPKDVKKEYAESVRYCLARGYMTVFPDGRFKPNMPVQYEHFNILMNRIYGTGYDARKLFKDMETLGHKSNYLKHTGPFISRAEAIYVLYKVAD